MGRGEADGVAPLLRDALGVGVDERDEVAVEDGVRVNEIDRVPVRVRAGVRVCVLVRDNVTVLDGVAPKESVLVAAELVLVHVRELEIDGVEDAVGRVERVGLLVRVKGLEVLVLVLVGVAEGDAPVLRLAEGESDWLGVGVPDGSTTLKVMIASLCRSRGG